MTLWHSLEWHIWLTNNNLYQECQSATVPRQKFYRMVSDVRNKRFGWGVIGRWD